MCRVQEEKEKKKHGENEKSENYEARIINLGYLIIDLWKT